MKQYTTEEKQAYIENRNKELHNKIYSYAEELTKLTNETQFNTKFNEYIEMTKKFWHYSVGNQILIIIQCPNASQVAGFYTWKDVGRTVKAGARAIWILAPQIYKEREKTITTNTDTGEIKEEQIELFDGGFITGFKSVPVFDISQTEGKEIPQPQDHRTHTNNRPELLKKLEQLLNSKNIPLIYKELTENLNGFTDGKTIIINSNISIDDRFQTGIHEYLHYIEHFKPNEKITKQQVEVEAEATSYIISRILGMETKSYNYIALYNPDGKLILKSLERISNAVKRIFTELEGVKIECEQVVMATC